MNDNSIVGCTLSPAELTERIGFVSQEILSGIVANRELDDGFELQFPGDETWLRKLTELVIAERKCCTFFHFEMSLLPNHGPILFRLRGSDQIKQVLRGIL